MLSCRGENTSSKYLPHNYVLCLPCFWTSSVPNKPHHSPHHSRMRAPHSHGSTVSTDLRHPQKSELRRRNPHSLTQPHPASRPDLAHAHTEHHQRPLSSYQPGCPLARSVGRAMGPARPEPRTTQRQSKFGLTASCPDPEAYPT